ncbi:MAG: hypothetical protein FWH32_02985 [Clostridiales bacterium]|nr:hypothetical protein [Clostridiales bacterium]
MAELKPKVRPKIGLLFTGLHIYWDQFPQLQEIGHNMYNRYLERFREIGDVVEAKFVDTPEGSEKAGEQLAEAGIDILFVFPFGYTTGMIIVPCIFKLSERIPIRLIVSHEDATYDYKNAKTADFLHHSGVCCIPEYAGTLTRIGRKFRVITGWLGDGRFWDEIRKDSIGAAAASAFRELNFAIIGNTYTNMTDMPTDDHRLLKAMGRVFLRPEVEEFEEEYKRVTNEEIQGMFKEFRELYDVDETVTDEHMFESAKIAVVFDKIIKRYDISGYGYYWWGEKDWVTHIRAQSMLAGSRLSSMGRMGVTEGDVKTAMAMKMMDLMGAGGMFIEFNSVDYADNFILVSHDGPVNFNVSEGRAKLQHLDIMHGKTGMGLGVDFDLKKGLVTIVCLTQSDYSCDTFKLIYTVGEVVDGDILNVGNPNGRMRIQKPIPQFMDEWCQEGPIHHFSLGIGDISRETEVFAQAMGFACVRI